MGVQFGGGRLGSVNLVAGQDAIQNFNALPLGPIAALLLTLSVTGKSSGSAFAAVVSTEESAAAEQSDDMDKVIDGCLARIGMFADAETSMFSLKPSELRTVLGLFNQRDLLGTFVNAVSIPASGGSATTWKITFKIPFDLSAYFEDGAIFTQGSERLRTGSMVYTGASSLTPTIVLANGSLVVSAISTSLHAELGAGGEHDIGLLWSANKISGLPTDYTLPPGLRLGLLHTTPVASSAVTQFNVAGNVLVAPETFGARYQSDRLVNGGYDITARTTPLLYVERRRKFMDFMAHLGKDMFIQAVSGVSSLNLYDIRANGVSAKAVEDVSSKANSGGPVTVAHPTPPSLPPGTMIPQQLQGMLPVRIMKGRIADGGAGALQKKSGPADAAAGVQETQIKAARAGGFLGFFRRS